MSFLKMNCNQMIQVFEGDADFKVELTLRNEGFPIIIDTMLTPHSSSTELEVLLEVR